MGNESRRKVFGSPEDFSQDKIASGARREMRRKRNKEHEERFRFARREDKKQGGGEMSL